MNKRNLNLLPNIGKSLDLRLKEVGIKNAEMLIELGSVNAFQKLCTIYSDTCLNTLYALEGAIQGTRWHNLSLETKDNLKLFFNDFKGKL